MCSLRPQAQSIVDGLAIGLLLASPAVLGAQTAPTCPPKTCVENISASYGKTTVVDPYRWLEDQESKETREWIEAQDRCTEAALSRLPGRPTIAKRLSELFRIDVYGLPKEFAGRYFFSKLLAGQDLAGIYVRRGANSVDELLVDPLPWSADHSASATILTVSRDGKLLAHGRREGGQDEAAVHVIDVDTHKEFSDVLPSADYSSVEITNDHNGIYYGKAGPDGPRAYYHQMGTDAAKDRLQYQERARKLGGLNFAEAL
jgi:prolyl oligopeptidase